MVVSVVDAFAFDKELDDFCEGFPSLLDQYIPVERIGEGTFSAVYKAIDVNFFARDNSSWFHSSLQDPDDLVLYCLSLTQRLHPKTKLQQALKQYFQTQLPPGKEPHFVALKRINVTSSPERVKDELQFLRSLGGLRNVIPLITALRYEDQAIAVYPFFKHVDFREYYCHLSVADIQSYMKELLTAVQSVHSIGIIHRDLKPNNFLYSPKDRRGVLVDFGLAQVTFLALTDLP